MIAVILMMIPGIANAQDILTGSWKLTEGSKEIVWTFVDGYSTQATFDKANKRFLGTWGGPYQAKGDALVVQTEFNTMDSTKIGQPVKMMFKLTDITLTLDSRINFTKIADASALLSGNWRITGRMQDGKMVEGPTGARKTLKILSDSRFQWVAINPEVKGFYGTGGGTYTFVNGKYTENIEFFSRDSTRVGASLSFDGKVEDGAWHHSGLNSRGEPLHEVWRRVR